MKNSTSNKCMLVFQIYNSTENFFYVNPTLDNRKMISKEKCIISPFCSQRICLPLERFFIPLDQIEGPPVDPNKQFIKIDEKLKPTKAQIYLEKLIFSYKRNLLNRIELNWKSSHMETGVLSLASLNLNYDKIMRIVPPQLLVQYEMEEKYKTDDPNTFNVPLHSSLDITVHVTNNRLTPIHNMKVSFLECKKSKNEFQSFMYFDRLFDFFDKIEPNQKRSLKFRIFLVEERDFQFIAKADSTGVSLSHTKIYPINLITQNNQNLEKQIK